jgi:Putative 2OG-Fe(II) oxygenase
LFGGGLTFKKNMICKSKQDLWPTVVGHYALNEDDRLRLFIETLITKDAGGFIDNNPWAKDIVETVFMDYIGCSNIQTEIIDGWVRRIAPGNNHFPLHCDNHYGGSHVMVIWVDGDVNSGNLRLYDPAFRNRQTLSDTEHAVSYTEYKFIPGEVIVFPADVWHEVTNFDGTRQRISINLILNARKL